MLSITVSPVLAKAVMIILGDRRFGPPNSVDRRTAWIPSLPQGTMGTTAENNNPEKEEVLLSHG